MNIFIARCAVVGYIRPNSVLVVCCGLLAKWLRVRVRIRAGARDCTRCISFLSCSVKSVVNTFVFVGTVSS